MSSPDDKKITAETTSLESGSVRNLYDNEFDPVYLAKSKILSDAIQDIGMGRYQWQLFVVAGFGWMADNVWPIVTSLIFTPVLNELHPSQGRGPYLTLSQNLGLLAGAAFWSFSADIIGRRWAFNLTFLITGLWGTVAAGSPSFAAIGVFAAFWSFGVGGNLPVDSAIFLEALPHSHQYLLTVMSVWWALGQLLATLIAWGLLGNYSCQDATNCTKANNMGWRYFLITMGGISLFCFGIRFFLFKLFESPKYYLSRGLDQRAVETIHDIARVNGKTSALTLADLEAVDRAYDVPVQEATSHANAGKSAAQIARESLSEFNFAHLREAFGTRKLAFSTTLVLVVWGLIGLAFPLYNAFIPYYLQTHVAAGQAQNSTYITYRNSLIIAVLGVPGSLLAGVLVELRTGRKGAIAVSTILTGVFLMLSTTARSSNAQLGWNCAYNFVSNIMNGVLYAYTPEIFPARIRGTAVGLAASTNRVLGVFAPIIAIFADLSTTAPIFVSGALFLLTGLLALLFPYESRGTASF